MQALARDDSEMLARLCKQKELLAACFRGGGGGGGAGGGWLLEGGEEVVACGRAIRHELVAQVA
jgi:hypothetical protein